MRVGLGAALARPTGGGAPASPNPNLLLWSEALDNAAWVKSGAVVAANAANDPDGQSTADHLVFSAGGTLRQTTSVAATTGAAATAIFTSDQQRPSVSGTFDGVLYVFSFYSINGDGVSMRLRIDRSGGFLRVSVEDVGDEGIFDAAWMKLETPNLTAYVKREGT